MALLLVLGELARRWGTGTVIPLALDDLAVAALLLWAAWRSAARGPAPLLLAWGAFCGLVLVLLATNSAPLFSGPPKSGAGLYTAALSALLILGAWACRRALRLTVAAPDRGP